MLAKNITWSSDVENGQFDAATHDPSSPNEVMQDSTSVSDCSS